MTDAEPKNPGQVLRSSRESLGLSLQEVAVATKINARVLKALEEGDRDALPAKSFARGFIRSYAAYLKIDAEPILSAYGNMRTDSGRARYADEASTQETQQGVVEKIPSTTQKNKDRTTPSFNGQSLASRVAIFAVIFLLVAMVIVVKKVKERYVREKTNPTVTSTLPHGVLAPPLETISNRKLQTQAGYSTPVTPPAHLIQVTKKPVHLLSPKPQSPKTAAAATIAAAPQTITKVVPPHPTQEIIVEALDNVDVTIRVGNSPPQKIHLVPQAVHTVKTNESVKLSVTDGGMVNIVRNGRDQGVPGQLGKPITLTFP